MKKFLSLVLALVMTMSLVTISAGATEYKDFTDKDEIQYAEAVTVLNKLGIITGYSEGDFRPEGELTRGAAAKILVSLLIGPDAATALGNESSPYPDVPAGNTFAGVISYCKTAGLISGYGDGTFRPQGTLTGYAFAKMLLGALGYKSEFEGFTGAGWNMNVARLGGEAGLFDRISFNGNATVTREQACQLALNTIKGTMVEYSGGMNITNGGQSIVVNPDRAYKTSNQEFATHISNRKASNAPDNAGGNLYTVEFGEEHFVDLRMDYDRNQNDWFGRPSNEWSWKKVTIGTFPIEADYVFEKQTSHLDATDAAKNRSTGLGGLKLEATDDNGTKVYTDFWLNGKEFQLTSKNWIANDFGITAGTEAKIADISDLTDNGVTVEVYVSDQIANFITDVVVVKTQLMEVRRVGSDYVSLQAYDNGKPDNLDNLANGFNQKAINVAVTNVQSEDDAYAVLSGLKAGDIVAVVPVATDAAGTDYEVADAYVPEQVKGSLTGADQYSTSTGSAKQTVAVTVGGTKYNVAQWSKDLVKIDADSVKVTKKDVTLYLDANGNAMLAKDVGSTEDFIIIGNFTQTMKDGRIVTVVNGWDINGEALELNLGASKNVETGWLPGDLAYYTNATANHADWRLAREGGKTNWDNPTGNEQINREYAVGEVTQNDTYEIKSSNVEISVAKWGDASGNTIKNGPFVTTDKSVKFVYVNYNTDGEVDSVEVKTGVQNVKNGEIKENGESTYGAQVAVKKDAIKAVVIKDESTDAMSSNLMYIRERAGGVEKDENGNMIYRYTVVMMKPGESVDEEVTIYSDDDVDQDTFVAYTAKENANYSNFYDLRDHSSMTNRTTATYQAMLARVDSTNNSLLYLGNYGPVKGDTEHKNYIVGTTKPEVQTNTASGAINTNGGVENVVRIRNAEIVDLRWDGKTIPTGEREIRSIDDLKWYFNDKDNTKKLDVAGTGWLGDSTTNDTFVMQLVVNDNPSSDYFRDVALIVITNRVDVTANNATELGKPASALSGDKNVTLSTVTPSLSVTNGGNLPMSPAQLSALTKVTLTASTGATITSVTPAGGTLTATLDALASGAPANVRTVTVANVADTNTLTVRVTAENGNHEDYTFTFKDNSAPVVSENWTNPIHANEENKPAYTAYKSAANYGSLTLAQLANVAKGSVTITTSSVSGAIIINTGVAAEMKEQFDSLLNWYFGAANVTYVGGGATRIQYKIKASDGIEDTYTFAFSALPTMVKVQAESGKGDPTLAVYGPAAKVSAGSSAASYADGPFNTTSAGKGILVLDAAGSESARLDPTTAASEDLTAGYTYIGKAFITFNAGSDVIAGPNAMVVTYKVNGEDATKQQTLVKADDTIEIIVKAAADIALTAGSTRSVEFASDVYDVTCTRSDELKDASASDALTVVFKTGADLKFLAPGVGVTEDAVTAKLDITDADFYVTLGGSGEITLPVVTYAVV